MILDVAGSSPVIHPKKTLRKQGLFSFTDMRAFRAKDVMPAYLSSLDGDERAPPFLHKFSN